MRLWNLLYRGAWIALAALIAAGAAGMIVPKWREYRAAQARKAEAEERVRLEEEMLGLLKERQERFARDPRFVQQLAHDLGMARPNEVLFRFRYPDPGEDDGPAEIR